MNNKVINCNDIYDLLLSINERIQQCEGKLDNLQKNLDSKIELNNITLNTIQSSIERTALQNQSLSASVSLIQNQLNHTYNNSIINNDTALFSTNTNENYLNNTSTNKIQNYEQTNTSLVPQYHRSSLTSHKHINSGSKQHLNTPNTSTNNYTNIIDTNRTKNQVLSSINSSQSSYTIPDKNPNTLNNSLLNSMNTSQTNTSYTSLHENKKSLLNSHSTPSLLYTTTINTQTLPKMTNSELSSNCSHNVSLPLIHTSSSSTPSYTSLSTDPTISFHKSISIPNTGSLENITNSYSNSCSLNTNDSQKVSDWFEKQIENLKISCSQKIKSLSDSEISYLQPDDMISICKTSTPELFAVFISLMKVGKKPCRMFTILSHILNELVYLSSSHCNWFQKTLSNYLDSIEVPASLKTVLYTHGIIISQNTSKNSIDKTKLDSNKLYLLLSQSCKNYNYIKSLTENESKISTNNSNYKQSLPTTIPTNVNNYINSISNDYYDSRNVMNTQTNTTLNPVNLNLLVNTDPNSHIQKTCYTSHDDLPSDPTLILNNSN